MASFFYIVTTTFPIVFPVLNKRRASGSFSKVNTSPTVGLSKFNVDNSPSN